MRAARKQARSRCSVEMVVANFADMVKARTALLPGDKVRRVSIQGVVDTGRMRMVLPADVVKQLGLAVTGKNKVRYANGRSAIRDSVEGVYVEIMGRHGIYAAIVEPKRREARIGAVVLQDLDFVVDPAKRRLVPRDPRIRTCELD